MTLTLFFNAAGLILCFVGASIFWIVGRREGPSLPFLADSGGKILAEIASKQKERDFKKNIGMVLVAVGFLCQFIALLF